MDLMTQALEQAGYTIETSEPDGDNTALTFARDGIRGRFAYPPETSQEAVNAAVEWINFKYKSNLIEE